MQTKIIIIGGGLAGLALGQGLKRARIPFKIYERDTSASFRAQGYRIRITPEGASALRRLFPDHLWKAFEATCAPVIPGGHQLNAKTGEAVKWSMPGPPTPVGNGKASLSETRFYNADRTVLRSTLLSDLGDHVEFGRKFERYEVRSDREIVVYFTDGTSDRCTFLVGADGVRSVVRRQLLPDLHLLDAEGRAVFGKSLITNDLLKSMALHIGEGLTLIGEAETSHMKLFCDSMRWNREQALEYQHTIGCAIPADYIYWVLVFRKDVVDDDHEQRLLSLSNEQSEKTAVDLTSTWHESVRALIDRQNPGASSTLSFLMCPPNFDIFLSEKLPDLRVTLIGDSCHPMPPVGGVGANSAFEDSSELCDALIKIDMASGGGERQQIVTRIVKDFEDTMLARVKTAVERSAAGARRFFGMKPMSELRQVSAGE